MTADNAQMLHRRKESELSLSACKLCADGQPLRGFPSQNDAKSKHTNAVKVSVKPFQRLVGCGATAPHKSPTNQNLKQKGGIFLGFLRGRFIFFSNIRGKLLG